MTKRKPKTGTAVAKQEGHPNLLRGGNFGNKGGGNMPSEVKAASRESYYARIPILESIADNKRAKHPDRIRAVEVLGRMGLSSSIALEDVKQALKETSATIRAFEFLSPEQQDDLLQRIAPHWRKL